MHYLEYFSWHLYYIATITMSILKVDAIEAQMVK